MTNRSNKSTKSNKYRQQSIPQAIALQKQKEMGNPKDNRPPANGNAKANASPTPQGLPAQVTPAPPETLHSPLTSPTRDSSGKGKASPSTPASTSSSNKRANTQNSPMKLAPNDGTGSLAGTPGATSAQTELSSAHNPPSPPKGPNRKTTFTLPQDPPLNPLVYNTEMELHADFFRLLRSEGVVKLLKEQFPEDTLKPDSKDPKLKRSMDILLNSEFKDEMTANHFSPDRAKEMATQALAAHTSASPFHSKSDHKAIARLCARLMATPIEHCPSYNEKTSTMEAPCVWEQIYMGLHSKYGPTAAAMRKKGKAKDKKAKKEAKKKLKEADKQAAQNTGKGKKGKKSAKGPTAPQQQAYINVHFPQQKAFKAADYTVKSEIVKSLAVQIMDYICERFPEGALLKMNTQVNSALVAPPLTTETMEDKLPQTIGRLALYVSGLYVTQSGWIPRGRFLLRFSGKASDLEDRLNDPRGEYDPATTPQAEYFRFNISPLQVPEVC
jgi:hypothetical protein